MTTKDLRFWAAALVIAGGASVAKADVIPYPCCGYNATTYTFTAMESGEIDAYFAGSGASYDNEVGLLVGGVSTGITGLDDHTSSVGQELDLGYASAGSTLVFVLVNNSINEDAYSDPSLNIAYDNGAIGGHNHVYSTPYTATNPILSGIPVGTFVAFEDEPSAYSDYNYNDETFVFTNVSVSSSVPEPATWGMMLLGFVGLGFVAHRQSGRGRVTLSA